jgi:hypothetical protein
MNQREARAEGRRLGEQAAVYCEVSEQDRREAGCDHAEGECFDCLTSAAWESEQNARSFSPWEFLARDINESGDRAEGLWEAYDEGVAVGIRVGARNRLRGAA